MSVVLSFCGPDFFIIAGDNRKTKISNGVSSVVDENCQKVLRLNQKVAVGFTGDANAAEAVQAELKMYNLENLTMERIVRIVSNKVKKINSTQSVRLNIIIGGKNKSNYYRAFQIDSATHYEPIEFIPSQNGTGRAEYKSLHSFPYGYKEENETLKKFKLDSLGFSTTEELANAMKDCIKYISTRDFSVNDKVTMVLING